MQVLQEQKPVYCGNEVHKAKLLALQLAATL
jgi:hypothetical protein